MQAVVLAGGLGTRLSEETSIVPKPLVEIGPEPILWHIMKIFAQHGVKDFIVCCGYKGHLIKKYFDDYRIRNSNVSFDLAANTVTFLDKARDDWRITLVDTGLETMTAGRLRRVREHITSDTFLMTYGDGVGNIDIGALLAFHKKHGKMATVTAVQPTGRFGAMYLTDKDPTVRSFNEKPKGDGTWINGGFFALNHGVLDMIEGDRTSWEHQPMVQLTERKQLVAYRHYGFWHPMDTLRDKTVLNDLWKTGKAPWRTWRL